VSGQEDDLVAVYLTVAVRTTAGAGPGVVRVPRQEAALLIRQRHGVPGERPPRGFQDGGVDGHIPGAFVPRLAPPEPGT
jgi:hypothetical protein